MRARRSNEAVIACPRMIRPGLEELPCEADILVTVGGSPDEGFFIDEYLASCRHTLSPEEEESALTRALDHLASLAYDRNADREEDD